MKNVEDIYPLSPMQQGMLFHTLQAPESGMYFEQVSGVLGGVEVAGFEWAWQRVVEWHPVLRTAFLWEGLEEPLQVVRSKATLPWVKEDWRGVSPSEQPARLEAFLEADRARGFALGQAPLMRCALLRVAEENYYFVWSHHHLLLDGWSLPLVLKEIMACYEAYEGGGVLQLAPPRPYRDYIAWLQRQDLAQAEGFWRQALRGFTAPTPLSIGRSAGERWEPRYAEQELRVSAAVTAQLQALARARRLTLNTVVQGAWAVLLSRYSGEEEVLFGVTVSGRPAELVGVEGMVGLFINTLPVRVEFPRQARLLSWLEQLQAQQVEREQYAYTPLVEIQGWSEVPRGVPLFDSLVVFENYPVDRALSEPRNGVALREIRAVERTNYPLTVIAAPGSELLLKIVYDSSRFEPTPIARLLEHLQIVLGGMAAEPEQRVTELPLLPEAERERVVVEWNQTQAPYPKERCIHELFETQVEQTPEAVGVVYEEEHLTYGALNARANQLAHTLQDLGVGPESLVGVCLERSVELVVGLLGVLKAGGAYVPLDPSYPEERLAFMLEDAQAAVLLTQQHLLEILPKHPTVLCLDTDWQVIAQESPEDPIYLTSPLSLAYVIYTSGSTGRPKGVQISHQSLVNFLHSIRQQPGLIEQDILLAVTTLSFDIAALELYLPLIVGAQMVLVSREVAVDGPELLEKLSYIGATAMQATPATWHLLLAAGWEASQQLKILCGGEVLPQGLAQQLLGKGSSVWNLYGPTETTIWSIARQVNSHPITSVQDTFESIGRPIANTQVYLLDLHLQPVPLGVPGELYIGGAGLARGYLHWPELTAERFIPHPFSEVPGARLYRTGDVARYLPDGNIEFLGRIDHQVKVRGFRIELGEIEAVLGGHPGVQEACVVVREDHSGEKRLVGYYVAGAAVVEPEALRGYLQGKLPEYMVPAVFMRLAALPLTPNGKLDRKALPAPERGGAEEAYVPPGTPIEELLAGIWAEVLHLERVGRHDHFFALGGHSLRAIQVVSRVRETLGVELAVRRVFECPILAELSAAVEVARQEPLLPLPPIEPVGRAGVLGLSFAQERLWFLDQLEGPSATYNIAAGLKLEGVLEAGVLQQSLAAIVGRHEVLRTTFPTVEGVAVQVIASEAEVSLPVVDLQGLSAEAQTEEIGRLAAEEAGRPFDLARGPLLRVCLLKLGAQAHGLLLTLHHIVADGWSMEVFVRELSALYRAFSIGAPAPLATLPIQYADYAQWQRHWLEGEVLEGQLGYWREQLAGAPALLELPTDHPRPAVQSFRGRTEAFALDAGLTYELKGLSQRAGVTLFMTLLGAFVTFLSRYSGQEDVVVGTPVANRNRRETEGLIGFFVNTLVLRVDLSGNPTVEELLARVRQVALAAYAHQEVPFERVVEAVQPERNLSHSPLFQVMLVLQNTTLGELELPGLSLSPLELESAAAKFDLTLVLSETEQGLLGEWEYSTDLFEAATIRRLGGHFEALLRGMVADPTKRLGELVLLSDAEREQVLVEWNGKRTEALSDQYHCLHQKIEAQVEKTPEAIAVAFEEEQLTYRELNQRVNQLAHHLRKLGVEPEVLVGVCVERSLELVVGLLGILKAGGAYVPLDPSYPPERLAFMVEDAQVPVLLTQAHLAAPLPKDGARVVCLDREWGHIAMQSRVNPVSGVRAENLAYVIYTSGSTGKPKGTLITHRGLTNYMDWCLAAYPLQQGRGSLVHSTIAFDATVTALFSPLLVGGTVGLLAEGIDLEDLTTALRRKGDFSLLKITPAHLSLLGQQWSPDEASSLTRAFVIGGENLTAEQIAFWQKNASGTLLFNEYGPTETVVGCVVYEAAGWRGAGSVPIGQAIPNTQVYVLDHFLEPLPIGVRGELYIGGAGVARGYLHRPDTTAERFIPDPFSEEAGARLYRTGDLVRYLADGNLEFLGRIDHQVKVRGFRIELGEIEAVLGGHPGVQEACAVVREDHPGEKCLVGYYVAGEAVVEPEALRGYLRAKLPEYMVPAAFIPLVALPLTPNGKVDRRALPAPERGGAEGYEAPRTPTEELLAGVWGEVLHQARVGRHDNFFALGGDSILSIQIVARAQQAGLRLTPKQLFQYQSIAELAAVVGVGPGLEAEQGVVSGAVPLTPIQGWFFEQALPEVHHFNQAALFEVGPELEPVWVQRVVGELLVQHDALRLRFISEGAGWQQIHAGLEGVVPFAVVDLSGLAEARQRPALEAVAAAQQASLNLSSGPLLRVVLFKRGAERPGRLLLVVHHLAVDGVSWRVLLEDFQRAYGQLSRGEAIELPPKTTAFKAWAERLWAYGQSAAVRAELDYWRGVARGVAALPRDYPADPTTNTVAAAAEVVVALSREQTRALLQEVPPVYHTQINDVLLTALVRSFSRWTGERALLLDLEGHGREELFEGVDLSRTVGWFTTLFPVRLALEAQEPGEALKSVKEQLRAIPYGGIGYGVLRYVCPDPEVHTALHVLPLAEVSFNYLGQWDAMLSDGSLLRGAQEGSGPPHSPLGRRPYLLEVNGFVAGGRLQLQWTYSTRVHRRATVEHLAQGFIAALQALIAHCQSPEAGGFTASDFPGATLSQENLDKFITRINQARRG